MRGRPSLVFKKVTFSELDSRVAPWLLARAFLRRLSPKLKSRVKTARHVVGPLSAARLYSTL